MPRDRPSPGVPCGIEAASTARQHSSRTLAAREPVSPLRHISFTSCRPSPSARVGRLTRCRPWIRRSQTSGARPAIGVAPPPSAADVSREVVFDIDDLSVHYGKALAVSGVTLDIHRNAITALIGPSGCGKSTVLRCLNRMNDLVPSARVDGKVLYHGTDLYGNGVDPIEVRRRIGMVFQRPNPFPKSIYDNVAYGLRILGMKDNLDDRVEQALRSAALWDEVRTRLKRSALRPLRRPAATALHRAGDRRRAGRDPPRRARVGARPDLDVRRSRT